MTTAKEIREKIAADIRTIAGGAKFGKVYSTHRNNIDAKNLPAVVVTTAVGLFLDGAENISLEVRVLIHDNEKDIENVLDVHSKDIYDLLPIGVDLGGLVEYMKPESFDYILDTDSNAGVKVLIFNVKYEV